MEKQLQKVQAIAWRNASANDNLKRALKKAEETKGTAQAEPVKVAEKTDDEIHEELATAANEFRSRRSVTYAKLTERGTPRIPVLRRHTGDEGTPASADASKRGDGKTQIPGSDSEFLYLNTPDRILELSVYILHARVQAALMVKDFSKAERMANESLELAKDLDFEPLVGKCSFWKGVAEYKQRAYSDAKESFGIAKSAEDVYMEAEWVKKFGMLSTMKMGTKETPDTGGTGGATPKPGRWW